jgi:hypothetical protein
MADISQYLQDILDAVYGEQVRGSIHDAISIINDVSEVVLTLGTAVDSASSSSTGFFTNSLYLNTNSYVLWKCVGTDSWASQGVLKGDPGAAGADGNSWYYGTAVSGKSVNPTVFSGSGITDANANDGYMNTSEGAVYYCVTGGDPTTATWSYLFTISGGGGGTNNYPDLSNKPQINSVTLNGNLTANDLGFSSVAMSGDYTDLLNKPLKKTTSVSASQGATSTTISDAAITTTSIIDVYAQNSSGNDVFYLTKTVTTGQIVLTFDALAEATTFIAVIM